MLPPPEFQTQLSEYVLENVSSAASANDASEGYIISVVVAFLYLSIYLFSNAVLPFSYDEAAPYIPATDSIYPETPSISKFYED